MAIKMSTIIIMALVIVSLVSVTSASSGTATYYTEYTPSACYEYKDEGTMIAAAGDALWANGAVCGKMYRITCTGAAYAGISNPCKGGSVTVKIVDHCPSPECQATIDLSKEAFSAIADLNAGKIQIDYTKV